MAIYTAAELNASETLGTSEAEIFSNSNKIIIKQLILANYTATDRTAKVKVVPSGGSTGDEHIIFGDITVQANTTQVIDLAMVVAANASIRGLASAGSSINVHISGVEVT
jgi:hypothetical protein|tara:strand:+ start:4485 stop:4814 length:330 start_codon:yes stop_codon:yes gene_type:complete